jgi:subtilisin family serine protease
MKLTQRKYLALSALLFLGARSWAVPIGIIDSGTDMSHPDLAGKVWENPGNLQGDKFTGDKNGWNFAENNNQVIDMSYVGTFSPDVKKFFDVQLRMLQGKATADDKAWLAEKRKDQDFIKELNKFGNFVHGTHVAGIASKNADQAKVMAAKIIPTEVKAPGQLDEMRPMDGSGDFLMPMALSFLVDQQLKVLNGVGEYMSVTQMKAANCSFGTSMEQAKMVVGAIGKMLLGHELTEAELAKYSKMFMDELVKKGQSFVKAAPKTFFVLAAGNDGKNNDEAPIFPANLKFDNTISVAATRDYDSLASFSNYGAKNVEVAAPGVGIVSAIPGNDHLALSGTSQATPFVTRVVGRIMDANSKLAFADVKQILMGTVDKKSFLEGKVKSSGVVNEERAVKAAELSLDMSLDKAIQQAISEVADVKAKVSIMGRRGEGYVVPLPSLFTFPSQ